MLEKLSARERNLLIVLMGVILVSIIYFGFIKHLYPHYRQVKDEFDIKREDLSDINARIKELNALEEKNGELHKRMESLTISFNKEVRNGINYYYIGKHAVDNGVLIRELTPKPYQDYGQYIKIPTEIIVRGKYRNILEFIKQVENDMPNTSEIISLEIRPAGWDKVVEVTTQKTEEEEKKESKDNKEANTKVVVNSLLKRVTNSSESKSPDNAALSKLLADTDPDIDAYITLITYAVKSPEILDLAGEKSLGRIDAFSPPVDIPIVEEQDLTDEMPEEYEDFEENLFPEGMNYNESEDSIDTSGGDIDKPENKADQGMKEEAKKEGSVPQVIIKETGDYSFPERDTNRYKGDEIDED